MFREEVGIHETFSCRSGKRMHCPGFQPSRLGSGPPAQWYISSSHIYTYPHMRTCTNSLAYLLICICVPVYSQYWSCSWEILYAAGYASDQRHYADQLLQRPHQGLHSTVSFKILKYSRRTSSAFVFQLFFIGLILDYSLPTFGRRHLHWRGAQEQDLQVGIEMLIYFESWNDDQLLKIA